MLLGHLLNALSSASKEDGIGVQFLLRPAYDGWSKASESHIDGMKKNKARKKVLEAFAPMDIMEATVETVQRIMKKTVVLILRTSS